MKTKHNPKLVKAEVVARAAKNAGGVYVFATRDSSLPEHANASAEIAEFPFHQFACDGCSTEFSSQSGLNEPYCPMCGSGETKMIGEKASVALPKKDAELAHFACPSCSTINVMSAVVALASDRSVHCVACSTPVKYNLSNTEVTADTDADDMDLVDVDTDEQDDDGAVDNNDSEMAEVDFTGTNDEGTENPRGTGYVPPVEPNEPLPDAPLDTNLTTNDGYVKRTSEGSVNVSMLDAAGSEISELAFLTVGSTLKLTVNDVIVATLKEEDAKPEHASMIHSEEFRVAVASSIKSLGLKEACANYGFKPVVVPLNVKNIVESNTKRAVETATAELKTAREEIATDFQQSVDIAAAGFAKNFWRNRSNPLISALVTELETAGIKKAGKLVDRVFAAHSIASQRQILDLARELAAMNVEARNGLAQSIDLASYLPNAVPVTAAEDESQDDEDDDTESVESRISAGATAITDKAVVASIKPRGRGTEVASIVEAIGDRQLFIN